MIATSCGPYRSMDLLRVLAKVARSFFVDVVTKNRLVEFF